ncbi:nucleoside phosphorylase domain-containing protein [Fusarium redolens]|uniref:Nucleoside phosphorylase domain-containing protein n=1 Tax=Fusarium redolens TaxID=48865 RepID=A0A9P9GKH7_FUSRE|nr:nucleoside phosphorylase domain-containing protein [Fusarium redolens]KAH7240200.1 nucleoside phosphorylase domain-containing protein [Fusarium redolens]
MSQRENSNNVFTHNDYTVGWVCALPKELTAATAMLDQQHPSLLKPRNDSNAYTLGSIGPHNIVITCLPKVMTGNVPAATVASNLVTTFPSIKVGLMVGIGGGVPSNKIRLGDVVFTADGFDTTGNATQSVRNQDTRLSEELDRKWSRLAAASLRNDSLKDVLFKSSYEHVENPVSNGDPEDKDISMTVKRKDREMCIHYGLIASGDKLIKDAASRNKLNEDLGGHVLCIEMEPAGLVNHLPCLVIRGSNDVEGERPVKDLLSDVHCLVSETREDVAHIRTNKTRKDDIKILDWLTTVDYGLQQSEYQKIREPGTGSWLFDPSEYQTWLNTSGQTWFCQGIPGVGKTILTSGLIEHLNSELANDSTNGVSYIFCNFQRHQQQTSDGLLACILKQLAATRDHITKNMFVDRHCTSLATTVWVETSEKTWELESLNVETTTTAALLNSLAGIPETMQKSFKLISIMLCAKKRIEAANVLKAKDAEKTASSTSLWRLLALANDSDLIEPLANKGGTPLFVNVDVQLGELLIPADDLVTYSAMFVLADLNLGPDHILATGYNLCSFVDGHGLIPC